MAERPADRGNPPSPRELIAHLARQFAKWQLPRLGDVRIVDAIPKTGTGKFDKKVLRRSLRPPPA